MRYVTTRQLARFRALGFAAALTMIAAGCGDDGTAVGDASTADSGNESGPAFGVQLIADPSGALTYRYDFVVCRVGDTSCRDAETDFAMSGGMLNAGAQDILRIVEDADSVETIKIAVEVTAGTGELKLIRGEGDDRSFFGMTELTEMVSSGDQVFEYTP